MLFNQVVRMEDDSAAYGVPRREGHAFLKEVHFSGKKCLNPGFDRLEPKQDQCCSLAKLLAGLGLRSGRAGLETHVSRPAVTDRILVRL